MVATYRTIAPAAKQAAATYAAYLMEQTLSAETQAQAIYYTQGRRVEVGSAEAMTSVPRVREDLDVGLAEALALTPGGSISAEQLGNILGGRRADGREFDLDSSHNKEARHYEDAEGKVLRSRVSAMDITFSAPKSFSVAFAMAGTDAERWSLLQCHREAVDQALRYVESILGVAGFGKGHRQGGTERARMAWATVDHFTSRPTLEVVRPDPETGAIGTELYPVRDRDRLSGMPQIHSHALLPNLMMTESGRLTAVNRDLLNGRMHEIGAVYHMILARGLRAISVEVVLDEQTLTARLPAIPEDVCKAFSPRTTNGTEAAIEYAIAQGLIASKDDWDRLAPDDKIRLVKTGVQGQRLPKEFGLEAQQASEGAPRKDHVADFSFWRSVAERIGFKHETVVSQDPPASVPSEEARAHHGWQLGAKLIEPEWGSRAVLKVADLRLAAARALIAAGGQVLEDIDRVVDKMVEFGVRQQGRWTAVLAPSGVEDAQGKITTVLHRDQEREVIRLVRDLHGKAGFALTPETLQRVTKHHDFTTHIGKEQKRAIGKVGVSGAFGMFIGVGGSGKTTRVLPPLVEAWQADGREVYGTALARRQADALQEAGVDPSRTLAMDPLLAGLREGSEAPVAIKPGSVVVVDELSQIGTRQLLELVQAATRLDFKVVMTGDERQCQSIEAGAIMDLLAEALGPKNIPEILTIMRQATAREQQIAALLRGNRQDDEKDRLRHVTKAIEMKIVDGNAELVNGSRTDFIQYAAREFVATEREYVARDLRVTAAAPTNLDAREISLAIRGLRQQAGEVGADAVVVPAINKDGDRYDMALAPGDRIRLYQRVHGRFRGPDGREHSAVIGNNGTVLKVLSVVSENVRFGNKVEHREGLRVQTANGKEAFVAYDKLRLRGTTRAAISYGDCFTIASSQGLTSDEHFHLLPNGSKSVSGWENYVNSSRHKLRSRMLVSAAAELRQVDEARPAGQPVPKEWADREREAWDNAIVNMARQPVKETARQLLAGALAGRWQSVRMLQKHLRSAEARERAGLTPTTLHERQREAQAAKQLSLTLDRLATQTERLGDVIQGGPPPPDPVPLPTEWRDEAPPPGWDDWRPNPGGPSALPAPPSTDVPLPTEGLEQDPPRLTLREVDTWIKAEAVAPGALVALGHHGFSEATAHVAQVVRDRIEGGTQTPCDHDRMDWIVDRATQHVADAAEDFQAKMSQTATGQAAERMEGRVGRYTQMIDAGLWNEARVVQALVRDEAKVQADSTKVAYPLSDEALGDLARPIAAKLFAERQDAPVIKTSPAVAAGVIRAAPKHGPRMGAS